MKLTPTGQSEYYDGNQIGRYAREGTETYFVVYNDGVGCSPPMWAMDIDVEFKVSISVDVFLIADSRNGLYRVPRDALTSQKRMMGGREQYVITATHEAVDCLGDPNDHLRRQLWIESGNEVDEGYHKRRGES